MEKLFTDFDSVDHEEWLKKMEKDLKGKSIDVLHQSPEVGIETKAYYHPQQDHHLSISGLFDSSADWAIRQKYTTKDQNSYLLSTLNDGINHLGITCSDLSDFQQQTAEVQIEYLSTDIQFENSSSAKAFVSKTPMDLNFDVLALNQKAGEWEHSMDDFTAFYEAQSNHRTIWISGADYGKAGASSIQELALTLAHINEYVHHLKEAGVNPSEAFGKLVIELSAKGNFLLSIASFRAIRELVPLLASAYEVENVPQLRIYGTTGRRELCRNDHNNNLLRQTTQCASAAIGGCSVITVDPLDQENENAKRLAKNIQLILKEECYLNKVSDPSGGAYAVESMTTQIVEKAWKLFQQIEVEGGLITWIKNNKVHDLITENRKVLLEELNQEKRTLLGVNKYQNDQENWTTKSSPQNSEGKEFHPLNDFILEQHYESKTLSE